MASAHPILARLESTIGRYRDTIARLTPELAHLREDKEIVMQYLSEIGSALKTLIADRQASRRPPEPPPPRPRTRRSRPRSPPTKRR